MNHHLVQFHEDDVFLIKGLTDYIGDAISSGNTGIAIATSDHLRMLESILSTRELLDEHGKSKSGDGATSHCSLQTAGKHDAAIRVERYFNSLQRHYPFSLRYAYPLNALPSANEASMFSKVCTLHSHV